MELTYEQQWKELVRLTQIEIQFEHNLIMNEMMYGSAYGPYLPVAEMTGLTGMLRDQIAAQLFGKSIIFSRLEQ